MRNLIYQYWDGPILPGTLAGVANMRAYAESIGADYRFDDNVKWYDSFNTGTRGLHAIFYGAFRPIYDDAFLEYDNVLYADIDIFAVDGLKENIFDGFDAEIGICTEPFQPTQRAKFNTGICSASDERWAGAVEALWDTTLPRTPEGLLKVYNAGLVMYSRAGLIAARERFKPCPDYARMVAPLGIAGFYKDDQNYLHAMLFATGMDMVELDNGWNSSIHAYHTDASKKQTAINDSRTIETKFVHIQLRGADHLDAATQYRITNLPQSEWAI